jgi:type III secretion protein N (ATPase)
VAALRDRLRAPQPTPNQGVVHAVQGLAVRATMPGAAMGELVRISLTPQGGGPAEVLAQVVALAEAEVVLAPLDRGGGWRVGASVRSVSAQLMISAGDGLLGRVLDGLGRVIDGGPPLAGVSAWAVEREAPHPMRRAPVATPLVTGVRVVDGLLTLGFGQRVGVLAPAGAGKSSLLAQLARGAHDQAHVVVLGLIGERGREVRGWVEQLLGPAVMRRAVVVVATSDQPPQQRVQSALVATAIAEYFRDVRGCRVLLLLDSLTRLARAHREVASLRGELPLRQGFPASLLGLLASLLERAGAGEGQREGVNGVGSVTAVYSLLTAAGEDPSDDPIADEVMGLLDGHISLSSALAAQGHWPAVDVPRSLSRLSGSLVDDRHLRAAAALRRMISAHDASRDLRALAGHRRGADPDLDDALDRWPDICRFLQQPPHAPSGWSHTLADLLDLIG